MRNERPRLLIALLSLAMFFAAYPAAAGAQVFGRDFGFNYGPRRSPITSSRQIRRRTTFGRPAIGATTMATTGSPARGCPLRPTDYSGRPATGAGVTATGAGITATGRRKSVITAASTTATAITVRATMAEDGTAMNLNTIRSLATSTVRSSGTPIATTWAWSANGTVRATTGAGAVLLRGRRKVKSTCSAGIMLPRRACKHSTIRPLRQTGRASRA